MSGQGWQGTRHSTRRLGILLSSEREIQAAKCEKPGITCRHVQHIQHRSMRCVLEFVLVACLGLRACTLRTFILKQWACHVLSWCFLNKLITKWSTLLIPLSQHSSNLPGNWWIPKNERSLPPIPHCLTRIKLLNKDQTSWRWASSQSVRQPVVFWLRTSQHKLWDGLQTTHNYMNMCEKLFNMMLI